MINPDEVIVYGGGRDGVDIGITKREFMATTILAGIVSGEGSKDVVYGQQAAKAVVLADELIRKLNGQ